MNMYLWTQSHEEYMSAIEVAHVMQIVRKQY